MCGICGIWSLSDQIPATELQIQLQKAVHSLRHRGPDDSGIFLKENGLGLGLGHTRLSVIDLSPHGHQPKSSQDGRYTMVFNGEIYNFRELAKALRAKGHKFEGSGDTEVLLSAFQEWGLDAIQRLIGMFAIGLWDAAEQSLTLVRDRLGVKPLYYAWDGRIFTFGSELKALHQFDHWVPTLDHNALGEYLQYGYISAPRSIFKGTYKLPAGHFLTLTRDSTPKIKRYWNPSEYVNLPASRTDADYEQELEQLLRNAFDYRMVSDVPVGIFLSGGIDSSLVASLLTETQTNPIHTFTIGFKDRAHDESRWAREIAGYLGTTHSEYMLDMDEGLTIARNWGDLFDEPFGDSSGIPTYLVSKIASEEVKVVLSADGGDELFNGYSVYQTALDRHRQLNRFPTWLRRIMLSSLNAGASALPNGTSLSPLFSRQARSRISVRLQRLRATLHPASVTRIHDSFVSQWLPDEISALLGHYSSPRDDNGLAVGTTLNRLSLYDMEHYLPEDILTKVDRTTMACSIEGREPLLDHRIAEFALGLPDHLLRGPLGPKHILKKILYRKVPRQYLDRPKQGFAIPLGNWLSGDLRELVGDYLESGSAYEAFDSIVLRETLDHHFHGNRRHATKVWFLLAFELWRDRWMTTSRRVNLPDSEEYQPKIVRA